MPLSAKNILFVEDAESIRVPLKTLLEEDGYFVESVTDGQEALNLLEANPGKFSVILSDIQMQLVHGHTFVRRLKQINDDTPIILIADFENIQFAMDAIKSGAHDFITKPVKAEDLKYTIQKAVEYSKIVKIEEPEVAMARAIPSKLIGESPSMKKIIGLIDRISRVDSTVLILGESGTGKEVLAQEIHRKSPRADKKFVAINCAAIPHDLLESELFGHAKGSFTGAIGAKKGLFEEAEGGTVFLDEIGDLIPSLQAKLLRVLQDRKIRAVGSNVEKGLDVRIIAATHKNLRLAIVEGEFREDLFYRLSVIPIFVSPLRERLEDIRPLAIHFAKRSSVVVDEGYKTFSEDALLKLQTYSWRGNVRELENVIERCLVMCPRNVIRPQDLSFLDHSEVSSSATEPVATEIDIEIEQDFNAPGDTIAAVPVEENFTLKDLEKAAVIGALEKADGKKAEAAKLLGIDRKTLHRKELEYNLKT